MPATEIRWASVQGLLARVTRLDSCGLAVTGGTAVNSAVTSGFIKVDYKGSIEAGDQFKVKNAAGKLCINEKGQPYLDYYDLTIDLCQIMPEFFELCTGQRILHNAGGDAVGFAVSDNPAASTFALEVWTRITGDTCAGGTEEWGYLLVPQVVNPILGDLTVENNPLQLSITANTKGAQTKLGGGSAWGRGPYTDKPLPENVVPREHLLLTRTTVEPPSDVAGYLAIA